MKYIITSGPMESAIDSVRKIKNSSSGKLGCVFVRELQKWNKDDIVYIHTSGALVPKQVRSIQINDHEQLLNALQEELIDDCVVIHAMAISDFNISGSIQLDQMASLLYEKRNLFTSANDITDFIKKNVNFEEKLSSKHDQIVVMERAIKVIDQIKKINPNCKLIGFKLLSNVSDEQLIKVGRDILQRANCEYVVANKKEEVTNDNHRAFILGAEQCFEVSSKKQIANKIIELLED